MSDYDVVSRREMALAKLEEIDVSGCKPENFQLIGVDPGTKGGTVIALGQGFFHGQTKDRPKTLKFSNGSEIQHFEAPKEPIRMKPRAVGWSTLIEERINKAYEAEIKAFLEEYKRQKERYKTELARRAVGITGSTKPFRKRRRK